MFGFKTYDEIQQPKFIMLFFNPVYKNNTKFQQYSKLIIGSDVTDYRNVNLSSEVSVE